MSARVITSFSEGSLRTLELDAERPAEFDPALGLAVGIWSLSYLDEARGGG
jgi:hypothetical protein